MRNLVLIGFMGSGKSTVGRQCARILGYRFRDSDTLIEHRAGKPISDIFREEGEASFRQMELAAIKTLSAQSSIVLSTGGGAVMNPANVAELRRTGIVVLLWASPEAVLSRTDARDTRPLLTGCPDPQSRVRSLLADRENTYRSAAHAVVDTSNLTRDEAVEEVLAAYRRIESNDRPASRSGK